MNKIFKDTKQFTFMSMMLALTILFVYTLGLLPANFTSAAILIFIPTIITSIMYGPLAGAMMGGLAGITILTRAITMPLSVLDPLFINPLLSVLPRIFIGITPYFAYKFALKLFKNSEFFAGLSAGFIGSVTNTALVMLMLYVLYAAKIESMVSASFKVFLISVITTNAILEAVLTAFLVGVLMIALKKRKES